MPGGAEPVRGTVQNAFAQRVQPPLQRQPKVGDPSSLRGKARHHRIVARRRSPRHRVADVRPHPRPATRTRRSQCFDNHDQTSGQRHDQTPTSSSRLVAIEQRADPDAKIGFRLGVKSALRDPASDLQFHNCLRQLFFEQAQYPRYAVVTEFWWDDTVPDKLLAWLNDHPERTIEDFAYEAFERQSDRDRQLATRSGNLDFLNMRRPPYNGFNWYRAVEVLRDAGLITGHDPWENDGQPNGMDEAPTQPEHVRLAVTDAGRAWLARE
jgi:hypothetical protein